MSTGTPTFVCCGGDRDMFRVTRTGVLADDILFDATVERVTGWELDGAPSTFEPYLRCRIKWDSCSHFWFGEDEALVGASPGYLHLCGVDDFRQHVALIEELYAMAFEAMGREPEPGERWDG